TKCSAPHRHREQERHRGSQEPPDVHALGREQLRQPERESDSGGDVPGVPDDEIPPEATECPNVLHASPAEGRSASRHRRSRRVSTSAVRATKPITPSTAASEPGQSTPAPSPPQKMPKPVSRTPTTNLSEFS